MICATPVPTTALARAALWAVSTRAMALPEGTQRLEFEIRYVYLTALECRVLYSIYVPVYWLNGPGFESQ